jgi:hypothetical protein
MKYSVGVMGPGSARRRRSAAAAQEEKQAPDRKEQPSVRDSRLISSLGHGRGPSTIKSG